MDLNNAILFGKSTSSKVSPIPSDKVFNTESDDEK